MNYMRGRKAQEPGQGRGVHTCGGGLREPRIASIEQDIAWLRAMWCPTPLS